MNSVYFASLVLGLLSSVCGDVYMHNPRGSNNRLNENSANRKNANRAFDSQVRTGLSVLQLIELRNSMVEQILLQRTANYNMNERIGRSQIFYC